MSDAILVALITLGGSAFGTFGGILASSKLTSFRLEQLEKKVEKHNNVVERTYVLEGQMREVTHDIVELKSKNQ